MNLGILGGTFDPIHYAHLFIAEEARARLELQRVIFVPNAVSPFKTEGEITPAEHRFEMARLAVADNPAFEVSRIEIDRPPPSFTVETLRELAALHSGAELYFITGADAAAEIEAWREPDEVLRLARVVVATRPGFPLHEVRSRLKRATLERIDFMECVGIDLAATDLRDRVRQGLPLRYLTPDVVIDYLNANRLYEPV
jgi:nicotinate-nucleotide adenylyltransferase